MDAPEFAELAGDATARLTAALDTLRR